MRVLGRQRLAEFMMKHPHSRAPVRAWLAEAEAAAWGEPLEVKDRYAHLSIVNDHYVFNIGGNKYRLDTSINFDTETILVQRIGTHSEYNDWSFD